MQRFFGVFLVTLLIMFPGVNTLAREPGSHRLVLLGDFLPAGSAAPFIRDRGLSYLFNGIRPILNTSDAAFVNLETPLSERGDPRQEKKYTFRAPPSTADGMFKEGIKVVSLANNHILDFGYDALDDTFSNLRAAGIAWTGAGSDSTSAQSPAVIHTPSGELAFLAFSNTFPKDYWAGKNRPGTLFGSPAAIKKTVPAALTAGPVIASFHWGQELMTEPKEYQIELAHLAIDSGASLVVGHHPHVTQPIEIYRGRPIIYSLGNFSFGSYSKNAIVGIMALATITSEGQCERLEIYPLLVDNTRVAFQPLIIKGLEGQRIFDPLTAAIPPEAAEVNWDGDKGIIVPRPVPRT
jgi:poly-gamma-glutamate synthesis protein (capsule biosynthesis protein)